MFRFGHISDVHLGYLQYGLQERRLDFKSAWLECCQYLAGNNVDFVLICGDLFHHKNPDWQDIYSVYWGLDMLQEKGIEVFGIYGNHDAPSYTDQLSWLTNFKVGSSMLAKNRPYMVWGINWAANRTQQEIEKILDKVDKSCYNILMLHAGVGDILPDNHGNISTEYLLSLKEYFNYIALGHIHKKYTIDNLIFNPGSLEACSSTELDYERGMFVVDVKDNQHNVELYKPLNRKFFKGSFSEVKPDVNYKDYIMHVHLDDDKLSLEEVRSWLLGFKPLHLNLTTAAKFNLQESLSLRNISTQDAFRMVYGDMSDVAYSVFASAEDAKAVLEIIDDYN